MKHRLITFGIFLLILTIIFLSSAGMMGCSSPQRYLARKERNLKYKYSNGDLKTAHFTLVVGFGFSNHLYPVKK